MSRALFTFRVLLVTATAAFMAYHTQIFIVRIEPNQVFAWTASLLIEGMLISLALAKGWVRLWLIPLFIISVLAASASFVVRNEGTLEQFIEDKEAQAQASQTVETLKQDLAATHKDFDLGEKYTTKTLQRERQIRDRLEQVLVSGKGQTGHIAFFNSLLFLVLVLVLQGVSVSTAMTLKARLSHAVASSSQVNETTAILSATVRQVCETRKNGEVSLKEGQQVDFTEEGDLSTGQIRETEGAESLKVESPEHGDNGNGTAEKVLKLKSEGIKPDEIVRTTGLSRATVYRILKKNGQG